MQRARNLCLPLAQGGFMKNSESNKKSGNPVNSTKPVNPKRRALLKYAFAGFCAGSLCPALFRAQTAHAAENTMRVLIAFYSRTGNTRALAEHIHALAGGDIVEIQTVTPYPADDRATTEQAKRELAVGYRPPLTTKITNMESYDLIFLGSPNWWSSIAPPVASFLAAYDFADKKIAPFITHGGGGQGHAIADMTALCPGAQIQEALVLSGNKAASARTVSADWLREIGVSAINK